jgi:hypothetical protein
MAFKLIKDHLKKEGLVGKKGCFWRNSVILVKFIQGASFFSAQKHQNYWCMVTG